LIDGGSTNSTKYITPIYPYLPNSNRYIHFSLFLKKRNIGYNSLSATAERRTLVLIFMLYPSLNNAIFRVLTCREFAANGAEAFNVYDYSVDCTTSEYIAFWWLAMLGFFIYSLGIPCFFLLLLVHNRDRIREADAEEGMTFEDFVSVLGDSNADKDALRQQFAVIDADGSGTISMHELIVHTAGVAAGAEYTESEITPGTRMAMDEVADDARRSRLDKTGEELAFLTKEYEADLYWFEVVEYTKKLIMTGVLMKAEQGSSSQVFFGLIISFVYFALVVRTLPYRSWRTDVIRVVGELQLFLTMLCVLMLRLDLHQEWMTSERVSTVFIVVNFVMTPVPFVYDVVARMWKFAQSINEMLEANEKRRLGRDDGALADGLLAPGGHRSRGRCSRCCRVPDWSELKELFSEATDLMVDLDAIVEEERDDVPWDERAATEADEHEEDSTGELVVVGRDTQQHTEMNPISANMDLLGAGDDDVAGGGELQLVPEGTITSL